MSIDPGRKQYTIQQLIIILVKYEYTIIMLFAIPIIVIIIIQYLRPCTNSTTNAIHGNIQTVIHTYKI